MVLLYRSVGAVMTPAQAKAAEYLHDMANELAQIAFINALPVAARCFEMAALEVEFAIEPSTAVIDGSASDGP